MTEVNFTELDRTVYELIRLKLVASDLLPDITLYATAVAYESAKIAHVAAGKKLVEVFGVGSSEARDKKASHRIVVDRKATSTGTLGGGTPYYVPIAVAEGEDPRFQKKIRPEMSSNVNYEVRLITNSTEMDRLCSQLIYASLGIRRHTKLLTGGVLGSKMGLIVFGGETNVSSTDFTERLFQYGFPDVWLDVTSYDDREVASLTSIKFSLGALNSAKEAVEVLILGSITV